MSTTSVNFSNSPPGFSNKIALVPAGLSRAMRRLTSAVAGAAVGSTVGIFSGPVGFLVGSLIGASVGLFSEVALKKASILSEERTATLDAAIGVSGGDIGAPPESCRLPIAREVPFDVFVRSFDVPSDPYRGGDSFYPHRQAA